MRPETGTKNFGQRSTYTDLMTEMSRDFSRILDEEADINASLLDTNRRRPDNGPSSRGSLVHAAHYGKPAYVSTEVISMRRIRFSLLLLIVTLTCACSLLAQVGSDASILGVVTDASGAVVPRATVRVVNLDTGLQRTATSGEGGEFEVLALPTGPYSVSVTNTGFSTWKLERIDLTVASRQRISPVLKVGEVTEQIRVDATAELIQTDRSSVSTVVEEKQIRELPLNGRNPVQLVALAPGMRYLGRGGPERGSTVQGVGGRDDATEFQLDGLNANAGMDEKGMAIPNVDTIAEFSVETNSFSAEQGRNPLQVLMLTKSGTNAFHGTLWEFLRNEKLDAFNTFAKSPGATKPKLSRNQFGATIGGPVVRNKTFFFASFEGATIRQARIFNSNTVLTGNAERRFLFRRHSDTRSAYQPAFPRQQDSCRPDCVFFEVLFPLPAAAQQPECIFPRHRSGSRRLVGGHCADRSPDYRSSANLRAMGGIRQYAAES